MATYTNLDNEIFSQAALESFVKEMAPLTAFSTNFSADAVQKGAQVLVPLVAALTATTFAGSYAVCNGSKSVITLSINRHRFISVGQGDLDAANSSSASLESFGHQQGRSLAQVVLEDIFSLVTTANFGLATVVASTALDVPQLRTGRLALNQANAPKAPRACLVDAVGMDALLGVTNFVQAYMFADNQVLKEGKVMRALGFDFHELNGSFTSAASVLAFQCHASAIAVAMRYLMPQPGHTYNDARAVADPDTGLVFGLRDFYDNSRGERFIAMECNYAYSQGITQGGRIIKRSD